MEEILSKIVIRKGAGTPPTLDIGEFGLDTINNKLYLGTANGNKEIVNEDDLPEGVTFKTINGQSIIGTGNIEIESVDVTLPEFKTVNGTPITGTGDIPLVDEELVIDAIDDFVKTNQVHVDSVDYDATIKTINHRGYLAAPENTIPAYIFSKRKGYKYVECDVRFTRDDIAVLLHDTTINRTSDGTGAISSFNYNELLAFDFGSWKSPKYKGTRIPTLDEFVACCKGLGLYPYIEVRDLNDNRARDVYNIVKKYAMLEFTTYISFSLTDLQRMVTVYPKARVGFISTTTDINAYNSLRTGQNEVFMDAGTTNPEITEFCKSNDIPLEVWGTSVLALQDMDPYISGVTLDGDNAGKIQFAKYSMYNFDKDSAVIYDTRLPSGSYTQYKMSALWKSGYLNGNNTINNNNGSGEKYYEQYIPVTPGQVVMLGNSDFTWSTGWMGIEFLSNLTTSLGRTVASSEINLEGKYTQFIAPVNAEYVRISSRNMIDNYHLTAIIYVGNLTVEPELVYYNITSALTGVTQSNTSNSVLEGTSYSNTFTVSQGYENLTITITMGGTDITSSVVVGNVVNIPAVTGDVTIKVIAQEITEPVEDVFIENSMLPASITSATHKSLDATKVNWVQGYIGAGLGLNITAPSNEERVSINLIPVVEGTTVVLANTDPTWESGWTGVIWYKANKESIRRDNAFASVTADGEYLVYTAPVNAKFCKVMSRNLENHYMNAVIYINKNVTPVSHTPANGTFTTYKNLEWETGYISSGSPSSNFGGGEMRMVDFLPITPEARVSLGNTSYDWNNSGWASFTFYTESKTYISGPTLSSLWASDGSWATQVAPSNAAYVKVSSRNLLTDDNYLNAVVYIENI